jgi:hypothetical protein
MEIARVLKNAIVESRMRENYICDLGAEDNHRYVGLRIEKRSREKSLRLTCCNHSVASPWYKNDTSCVCEPILGPSNRGVRNNAIEKDPNKKDVNITTLKQFN